MKYRKYAGRGRGRNQEGEFLVKGPTYELVGSTIYEYKAVIVFPSNEIAKEWFNSPEYQELTTVRDEGMDATFLLIG